MTTLNHLILKHGVSSSISWAGNMIELFNIPDTLLSKGFEKITESTLEDTLLSSSACNLFAQHFQIAMKRREFIEKFNFKEFRTEIKNQIYNGTVITSQEETNYAFEKSFANENRFTKTIELLIAYLCVNELKAHSASFGVKIKEAPNGGDFDCIANFQNLLVHFEVKSGNQNNIKTQDLSNFLERHNFLAPYFSVLFLDYEGGVNKLDEFVKKFRNLKSGSEKIYALRKIINGTRKFYAVAPDIVIVDIHNDGNILSNLRLAMQYIHRYNAYIKNRDYYQVPPNFLGYEYSEI